ncbi:CdaR family protein [Ezakiella peruensis]|uniref:CdaR family protein n=1 Tax=Ezakiella peruensis TaxID=1464038 RepID=UPI000C1B1EF0|nr:CdaR family protein [Ezakiella peruensis]
MKLKKKKNNQKNRKNQNLVAKIMSLVIAVLLWSYVMTIENPDERKIIRNVRVKFLNADLLRDSDNQLMTQEDQFVNITLRGKKNELEKVRADMINASVDLEGYGAGNTRIPIDVNLEGVSSLVSVDTISPPSIIVNIDKVVSRDFEVQVDTKGNPMENYMKGDNQLSSPKVQVTGPASQIGIIDSIRTNIDVDGKEKGFTVTNPLYAVDANGNRLSNVSIKPDVVTISVPIYKTAVLVIEPSTVGNLPVDFETTLMHVNPPTIAVKIIDENAIVPKTIKTEPINMEELVSSDEKMLTPIIPEGMEAIDPSISYSLTYQIQKYTTKRFAVDKSQIKFENLPEHLSIDLSSLPTIVDITVRGYEKELKALNTGDVVLAVNLENAELGEESYNLKLQIKDKPSLSLTGAPKIKLNIIGKENSEETPEEKPDEKPGEENGEGTEENNENKENEKPDEKPDEKQ